MVSPGYHLSHEMWVQLGYTSHTCINLHVYNDKSRYYLTEILREKTLLAPGFKPAAFQPTSSSLQPLPSLQVFRPIPAYSTRRALTGSQYSGGPSCGCYSHSFGRQQTNPEPVHPIRVAVHLLDSHAPATVPGLATKL